MRAANIPAANAPLAVTGPQHLPPMACQTLLVFNAEAQRSYMRKTNDNLILVNALFVTALVISNVVTAKLFHTGLALFGVRLVLPGAAVCYACTFLFTDVIGEIWGRAAASKSVVFGFICQIFASALILLTQKMPAEEPTMQEAYDKLLGMNLLFVFASLVAYVVSQWWDVWFFHKIREW